jgi:hypothetical protein
MNIKDSSKIRKPNKLNKSNKYEDIIPGYKGIMDLDMTEVPEEQKNILMEQHFKDIANYKKEQATLKPHLRYENTIERVKKIHKTDQQYLQKHYNKIEEDDIKRINVYNSRFIKRDQLFDNIK